MTTPITTPTTVPTTPITNPYDEASKSLGPSTADYYKGQLDTLGVPALNNTVQTFKNETAKVGGLLNDLPQNINDRTRGSLTSQAQVDRMNAVEGGVLRNQLSKLGSGAQPAIDALNTALTTANQQTNFYTQDKSQKLSILMDKIHRGEQLSDAEWKQASELATLAKQNEYAVSSAEKGNEYAVQAAAKGHEYNLSEEAAKSKTANSGNLDIAEILKQWSQMNGGGNQNQQVPTDNQPAYLNSLFPGSTTSQPASVQSTESRTPLVFSGGR